jgi:hypothetical protein
MHDLRSRIVGHDKKIKNAKELDAALLGVFDQDAQAQRERFEALVQRVVRPMFEQFKATVRQIGRDAVIMTNLAPHPAQSITLILIDRYLKFGTGKTLNLVNPKEDITQRKNTKFYEVYRIHECVFVKERALIHSDPISTQVAYEDIIPEFLENELARFFERAYPATS